MTRHLHDILVKRQEHGAPLQALDLRTCIWTEGPIKFLSDTEGSGIVYKFSRRWDCHRFSIGGEELSPSTKRRDGPTMMNMLVILIFGNNYSMGQGVGEEDEGQFDDYDDDHYRHSDPYLDDL
jgi:hypothetical protein